MMYRSPRVPVSLGSRALAAAALPLALLASGAMSCSSSPNGGSPPQGGQGGTNAGTGGALSASGGDSGQGAGGQAGSAAPSDAGMPAVDAGHAAGGTGGGAAGTGGAATAIGGAGGATSGTGSISLKTPWPTAAILTGVRDVATPLVTQTVQLRNDGTAPVMITAIALAGTNANTFRLSGIAAPVSVAAGASMPLTVELLTSGTAIPAAPPQNSGGTLLTAILAVTSSAGPAQATVYGLLLTTATHEVTLGQILTTLGIKLNVGLAQNNANPNTGTVQQLPKVEPGTDEIAAPLYRKTGSGSVTMTAVARFSPKGPMPFGWYPAGTPATRNMAATMASMPDAQTSDKARMMLPPLSGSTAFDPGAGSFGVWVYTDQLSQLYDTGGTASNGDYDYSEDAPNSPANVHRMKVYPLKDSAGIVVAGSYLIAVEEAGNGDYQDYVFILSNVQPAT